MHIHAMRFAGFADDEGEPCEVAIYVSTTEVEDPAATLIKTVLGSSAGEQARAHDRAFPLRIGATYLSVTHAGRLAAIATSTAPVGIDAEEALSAHALEDMRWCLSVAEYDEATADVSRLTEIWTAKEATAKLTGSGLWPYPAQFRSSAIAERPWERRIVTAGFESPCSSVGLWLGKWHLSIAAWQSPGTSTHRRLEPKDSLKRSRTNNT